MIKKYFYFSKADRKLRYDDNRPIELNTTHTVEGELKLCENGLHASERPIDALKYAPGAILWLVELGDEKLIGDDKVCSRSRKYLAEFDVTNLLREFARKQAMINIELIKPYCTEEDYALIVKYLETGEEELRDAAYSAARSAAYSVAYSTASSAARSAASSAAQSAASSAAWSAYWAAESVTWAARSAAESAAESAAKSAAESAADSVADSAARSAARSAAESAANDMLVDMIREATGWEI